MKLLRCASLDATLPDLRFVAVWNKWLRRDGSRWRFDNTLHALTCARSVCRAGAAVCTEPNIAVAIASAKTVAAVERLSRADPRLAATVEQWDEDPWLINTPGGVVDLRTGRTRPHRADDYMTMVTVVAPGGDCPKWKAFLDRIMGRDAEAITYLKRVFGYCLTGDTSEQAIFFAFGSARTERAFSYQTIGRIMGDYRKPRSIETFTESKTDRHPTELARLNNARLVTASETEDGKHWAESRIKLLTGGDTVTARFMRQDDFEYVPKFKPFFSGNHKPDSATSTSRCDAGQPDPVPDHHPGRRARQ